MLLRDYLKVAGLSLPDMVARLQRVALPGELDRLAKSTIMRHASGEIFPSARQQELYVEATDRAVMPEDHVRANNEFRANQQEGINSNAQA